MEVSQDEFEYMQKWAMKHAAADIASGKKYLIETRLDPVIYKYGFKSFSELINKLRISIKGDLYDDVIDAITTHETSFFRDIKPFDFLKNSYFPSLIESCKITRRISVWSAACSTGQEVYSTAIMLREYFPQFANWDIVLYATDISEHSLAKARSGEYTQLEVNRGLPIRLLVKYFTQSDNNKWVINEDIRKMIKFEHLNLIAPWPKIPPFHLIYMRNVMIYFDVPTKKEILHKLKVYLKRDGILMLGNSETALNLDDDWKVDQQKGSSVYQLSEF